MSKTKPGLKAQGKPAGGVVVDAGLADAQMQADLDAMAAGAVVAAEAGPDAGDGGSPPAEGTLANFALVHAEYADQGGEPALKTTRRALRIDAIVANLLALSGGWPRSAGGLLFVEGFSGRPEYLTTTAELFAWVQGVARLDWARGSQFGTKEEFLARLKVKAERFDAIEVLPHHPPVPGAYYLHPPLAAGTGGALETYLDFFCPATPADRVLMRAALMTPFWGGSLNRRPAFLVTGPDQETGQGRGVGKTTFVDVAAEQLLGGFVDVTQNDKVTDIKTRLLSPEGRPMRVCRLDNLKTLRFSWGDLEGLITATTISGRALYHGEGQRLNTLTWFITINGASLSKDMALRVIPLKLARPAAYQATWDQNVLDFARTHRDEIIADIIMRLKAPGTPTEGSSRWAPWERGVLAHAVADGAELKVCQALIGERQGAIDDDDRERVLVRAHFRQAVRDKVGSADDKWVFIPSEVVARWLKGATNEERPTSKAMTYLEGLGIPELSRSKSHGYPGFHWRGESCAKKVKLTKPFEKVGGLAV